MNVFVRTLAVDLRFAIRAARKNLPLSLLIIVSLAIAIGFNAAVFSVFHALFLSELPFAHTDRLVTLWSSNEEFSLRAQEMTGTPASKWKLLPVSILDARDWTESSGVFEALAVHRDQRFNIDSTDEPVQVAGLAAQANLFDVLGAQPVLGTLRFPDEEGGGDLNVAVLGYSLWQRHFAGRADVLGQDISLNNQKFRIIGIAPAGLNFPRESEVWVPLRISPDLVENRQRRGFEAIARLRPGVRIERAQEAVSAVAAWMETDYAATNAGWTANVVPLRTWLVGDTGRVMTILVWAVFLVTAIASGNMAGLLLGRGIDRAREISIRRSLGASAMDIARLVATESVVLALAGGCAGLVTAHLLLQLVPHLLPESLLLPVALRIAAPTVVYTMFVALAVALVSSILPAVQALRASMSSHLQCIHLVAGGRRGRRLRGITVGAQVALTVMLLIGAALMVSTLGALTSVSVGADVSGITVASLNFAPYRYPEARRISFARELPQRAQAFGIADVGLVDRLPFGGGSSMALVQIENRSDLSGAAAPMVNVKTTTGSYFRALRIALLQGRLFDDERDTRETPPVVVVNRTFSQRYWPSESPIGHRVKIGREATFREIVGVVNEVRHSSLDAEAGAEVFLPFMQNPSGRVHLMLRSSSGSPISPEVIRRYVHSVDAGQAVEKVQFLEDLFRKTFLDRVILGTLLVTFGLAALVLALVGVYGNVMAGVNQRVPEIGVRMALGATRGNVLVLFLRSAVAPGALAIAAGMAGGIGVADLLRSELYGVQPIDPATFLLVPITMVFGIALAAYVPALRETRLDPAASIRRI